jgi:hypothetical protein
VTAGAFLDRCSPFLCSYLLSIHRPEGGSGRRKLRTPIDDV